MHEYVYRRVGWADIPHLSGQDDVIPQPQFLDHPQEPRQMRLIPREGSADDQIFHANAALLQQAGGAAPARLDLCGPA